MLKNIMKDLLFTLVAAAAIVISVVATFVVTINLGWLFNL